MMTIYEVKKLLSRINPEDMINSDISRLYDQLLVCKQEHHISILERQLRYAVKKRLQIRRIRERLNRTLH